MDGDLILQVEELVAGMVEFIDGHIEVLIDVTR